MANQCIPYMEPGNRVTCHAAAAITGKCFVEITADAQAGYGLKGLAGDPLAAGVASLPVVGAAVAAARNFGVAERDAPSGGEVEVFRKMIVPVTASNAAITAGQEVEVADTAGHVKTLSAGVAVGKAMSSCAANGDCLVALY